jgi:hypothetical protein
MSIHNQCIGETDEWYTPPHVFDALGCHFDMDVASPGHSVTPWIPAYHFVTFEGRERRWDGLVWMNPPFGGRNGLIPWLDRFFDHGNGIALTPDRTSAPWWQQFAPRADLILFTAGKIKFIGQDGKPGKSPADGTSLMAVGPQAVEALCRAGSAGLGFLSRPVSPAHHHPTENKGPDVS